MDMTDGYSDGNVEGIDEGYLDGDVEGIFVGQDEGLFELRVG
jgi:hypothetical protein